MSHTVKEVAASIIHAGVSSHKEAPLKYAFGIETEFVLEPKVLKTGKLLHPPLNHEDDYDHYTTHSVEQWGQTLVHKYHHYLKKHHPQYASDHVSTTIPGAVMDMQSTMTDDSKEYLERIQSEENKISYRYWVLEGLNEKVPENKHENLPVTTHVHLGTQESEFQLDQLKLICAAVIHWEPAWEAVLPWKNDEGFRGSLARSLYLENPNFAPAGITRSEAINMIERCRSKEEFIDKIHPHSSKFWNFNFGHCTDKDTQTIEFRRGDMSTSEEHATMWTAVAVSFMLAALKCKSVEEIEKAKVTVSALEQFMLGARDHFHATEIQRLFEGKRHLKTDRPRLSNPSLMEWTDKQKENMMEKTEHDAGN
ncbi:MAG: hypothetical protein Q9159_000881 [Coniocarpon cinnabarinum]